MILVGFEPMTLRGGRGGAGRAFGFDPQPSHVEKDKKEKNKTIVPKAGFKPTILRCGSGEGLGGWDRGRM